jgi:hypothetical protein
MTREQRRAVVLRFAGVSALVNLAWFLITLPPYGSRAAGLTIATVALYGQGILFALGLRTARRFAQVPLPELSRRSFRALLLGQPVIVIVAWVLAVVVNPRPAMASSAVVLLSASVLAGALVGVCLRSDTRSCPRRIFAAILLVAAAWAGLPIAISQGWDVTVLHLGTLGGPSDRILHPIVTALWQIPMSGLVAAWLLEASQSARKEEVH